MLRLGLSQLPHLRSVAVVLQGRAHQTSSRSILPLLRDIRAAARRKRQPLRETAEDDFAPVASPGSAATADEAPDFVVIAPPTAASIRTPEQLAALQPGLTLEDALATAGGVEVEDDFEDEEGFDEEEDDEALEGGLLEEEEEFEELLEPVLRAEVQSAFDALGLDARVTGNLEDLGILEPTPVQTQAIPHVLSGRNVAIQCYTGSGKTLAYLLPILATAIQRAEQEYLAAQAAGRLHEAGALQALVVAPNQELAMQIFRVAQSLLKPEARNAVQQCIGGASRPRQVEALAKQRPIMVVGTPGRLCDLSREGKLLLHQCGMLVLDEADQLLAAHFQEEMVRLTQHCGRRFTGGRQTLLVSATLTPKVLKQCTEWCPDPVRVFLSAPSSDDESASASSGASSSGGEEPEGSKLWSWGRDPNEVASPSASGVGTEGVAHGLPPALQHCYVTAQRRHAVDAVRRTIHALGAERVLVFMNYQHRLKDAVFKLGATGMPATALHGEMTKLQRQQALNAFRRGRFRALMVSDVAARGLDVQDCDAVVNLELPSDHAHYAHRAGRTGRMGREGTVVTIIEPAQRFVVERMARQLKIEIPEVELRGGGLTLVDSKRPPAQRDSKGGRRAREVAKV